MKKSKESKRRGLVAGSFTARLAGALAKYVRAHNLNNKVCKREARNAIADMIGIWDRWS